MPRTILIVDDDRELCELVGELLRAEGFDVEAHHTGEGAAGRFDRQDRGDGAGAA